MSEWNEQNWKEALISVFERSTRDPDFRLLCTTDPIAAIKEVSDIEVPDNVKGKIHFFGEVKDYDSTYLLPPVGTPSPERDEQTYRIMRWEVLCTQVPTTLI